MSPPPSDGISEGAMSNRLPENRVSREASAKIQSFHSDVVAQVKGAISKHRVVVVGMAQNPHVRNVRRALKDAGVEFEYLEYGSYLSKWKERLAIKLWSGWPTFPQVYLDGVLIGGEDLTKAALAAGRFGQSRNDASPLNARDQRSSTA
jgi:monothiol glutaredoxin